MALDDATSALMEQVTAAGFPPLHSMTPEQARGLGAAMSDWFGAGPEMSRVETHTLATDDDGSFDVRLLVPHDVPRALIVYLHGGGWVMGTLDEFDTLGRQLADRTSAVVLMVGYRLAPEHPYPAAVNDAYQALIWANNRRAELVGDDGPLIVMGDSAGGNLAAVLSRRARDENGPHVAMQILFYPITDGDFSTPSYLAPENQLLLQRETMVWYWDHYLPDDTVRNSPDASPLRAEDLRNLPPALVVTAEHDVLRDEGEAYAARLEAAGVPVTRQRLEGQMHGFFTMVNVLPGSATGMDLVTRAIDSQLFSAPS